MPYTNADHLHLQAAPECEAVVRHIVTKRRSSHGSHLPCEYSATGLLRTTARCEEQSTVDLPIAP